MQTGHLGHENPDCRMLEGKTAFQPDCGQQQEKAQQGAENKKKMPDSDIAEKDREALKPAFDLAQQPPWKVRDVRKGNSKTSVRSPKGTETNG